MSNGDEDWKLGSDACLSANSQGFWKQVCVLGV